SPAESAKAKSANRQTAGDNGDSWLREEGERRGLPGGQHQCTRSKRRENSYTGSHSVKWKPVYVKPVLITPSGGCRRRLPAEEADTVRAQTIAGSGNHS